MKTGLWLAAIALGLAAGVILSGCESADGLNGLQVNPQSATLGSSNLVQNISVTLQSDLALPLQWSLSAPSLGTLTSSGSNAVYIARSGALGNQVVTVKDQYGNDGTCSILQVE